MIEALGDSRHRLILLGPVIPVLHTKEEQAAVGAIAIQAGTAKDARRSHIRLSSQNRGDLFVHLVGDIVGGALRRHHKTNAEALIFRGDKAGGHRTEGKTGEQNPCPQGAHDHAAVRQNPIEQPGIEPLKAGVVGVEGAEDHRHEIAQGAAQTGEEDHRDWIPNTRNH